MEWFKKALIRAIKTFAQTMASFITVGLAIDEINWKYVVSVSIVAFIYSILTSLAGLPELKTPTVIGDIAVNPNTADAIINFDSEESAAVKLGSTIAFNVIGIGDYETIDTDYEEGDEDS